MKTALSSRYEFTADGKAIIDIFVESMSDLFNTFDKKAAFSRRELDQDFVDYLVDCVKELGKKEFLVRISVEQEFNMLQETTLRKAIRNHFDWVCQLERRKIIVETRKFVLLMIFGISLLALVSKYKIPDQAPVELWLKTLYEGAIIASWVAIWEALTSIFFSWTPYMNLTRIYRRLLNSEIIIINTIARIAI
jgi:hypothetical protein